MFVSCVVGRLVYRGCRVFVTLVTVVTSKRVYCTNAWASLVFRAVQSEGVESSSPPFARARRVAFVALNAKFDIVFYYCFWGWDALARAKEGRKRRILSIKRNPNQWMSGVVMPSRRNRFHFLHPLLCTEERNLTSESVTCKSKILKYFVPNVILLLTYCYCFCLILLNRYASRLTDNRFVHGTLIWKLVILFLFLNLYYAVHVFCQNLRILPNHSHEEKKTFISNIA